MKSRLELLTADLETLFMQEMDGVPIDTALRDRVESELTDSDWFEIATVYWPAENGQTIVDLDIFLSWIHDSPIWNR
jgi:hypothetical protein